MKNTNPNKKSLATRLKLFFNTKNKMAGIGIKYNSTADMVKYNFMVKRK
jgi:hypothetical protein